jgi:hypothetical protein
MSQAGLANAGAIPPPPGSVTDLEGQDSVVVPPNGSGIINVVAQVVAAGTTPFTTTGNAGTSTETWSIQRSQAIAATDATKVGLAAFKSAHFSVDANGFVSSLGAGFQWIDQATSITLDINKGYFVTAATTQTLPAAPAQGDTVKIICDTASAVVVTANTGQTIRLSSSASSTAGTLTNTARGDALELIYRAATTQWIALNAVGNWTVA